MSTDKAKYIKNRAKTCIKKNLSKSTFNKSVTIATEHALIYYVLPKI